MLILRLLRLTRPALAGLLPLALLAACTSQDVAPTPTAASLAGPTARFVVRDNRLYTANDRNVDVYTIAPGPGAGPYGAARLQGSVSLGATVQSIQSAGSYLVASTTTGLMLLDATAPQPTPVGSTQAATSCDQLAADARWAYFATNADRPCSAVRLSQLLVLDLNDPARPQAVRSYPLAGPLGLAIEPDSGRLYVCDEGLKVFGTRQTPTLSLLTHQADADALDVQASAGWVLVTGQRALTQYRYVGGQLRPLSTITINRP